MSISASNISAQDVVFSYDLNGRAWRWKTRMDLSGSTPTFQVFDILTPYGIFRDSVPLPGPIVEAMAESIQSLKSNFKPSILVGPPTSLSFVVDEGRGLSFAQVATVTNSGVFGSLLSASLGTSAPYISVHPSTIGQLSFNQTGTFQVSVDSTDLLPSSSPYVGSITVQDFAAPNSPQVFPVTIVVRPKAVIDLNPAVVEFHVSRPISGPFSVVPTQQFAVQNAGLAGSVLDFQILRLTGLSSNWLSSFNPLLGSLNAAQTSNITVQVAPEEGLLPGTYEETLRVSGYSINDYADVLIRLVVT